MNNLVSDPAASTAVTWFGIAARTAGESVSRPDSCLLKKETSLVDYDFDEIGVVNFGGS